VLSLTHGYQITTLSNEEVLVDIHAQTQQHLYFATKDFKIVRTDGTKEGTFVSTALEKSPSLLVPVWSGSVCAIVETKVILYNETIHTIYVGEKILDAVYVPPQFLLLSTQENNAYSTRILDLYTQTNTQLKTSTVKSRLSANSKGYFTSDKTIQQYNPSGGVVTEIWKTNTELNCFNTVADNLYFQEQSDNATLYMYSTTIQEALYTGNYSITVVDAAPSQLNPTQVIPRSPTSLYFCDWTFTIAPCSSRKTLYDKYTGAWSSAKNSYYYHGSVAIFKAIVDVDDSVVVENSVSLPTKKNANSNFLVYSFVNDAKNNAILYTVSEVSGTNVYQVYLGAYNLTTAKDKLLVSLCEQDDGTCFQGSNSVFVMNDGSLLAQKRDKGKNVLVKISGNVPEPTPTPGGSDLTWIIVVGSIIGAVVLIGIAFMIGIAIKSVVDRNRGYDKI
jgi:hypothetical protein